METILVTGSNGEVGHGLIPVLKKEGATVIALDVSDPDKLISDSSNEFVKASVLQRDILSSIFNKYKFTYVYHLAALLSTSGEKVPDKAQAVNAGGTATLLSVANESAALNKQVVKFIFPSTIAVYGLPDLETKNLAKKVTESEYLDPITMYGITKLYCENLGRYYSNYFQLLSQTERYIDFRSVRYPGIISALTLPTGGTSDYAPEMIHSAAKGEGYESFVRPDTKIPFMVMPDAIKALLSLAKANKAKLTRQVYNVSSFSVTANEIEEMVNKVFPDSAISYNPDQNRQKIVDSWPADIDDTPARTDFSWQPDYDVNRSFEEYLIPEIQKMYAK
jgi:threonine 3-dehydrogenase